MKRPSSAPPDSRFGARRDKVRRPAGTGSLRMFHIQLSNFRCFAEMHPLEVRPITFLVGENSVGKTTFLAAMRLLLESFNRSSQNPFNTDPYFLGGFDQIANYHGGSRGRAKSFSLEIQIPARKGRGELGEKTSHKFTYIKGSPQPELSRYEFKSESTSIALTLAGALTVEVISGGVPYTFKPEKFPSAMLRRDFEYLPFVLADVVFGLAKSDRATGATATDKSLPPENLNAIVRQLQMSIQALSRRTFASAPVRTQPLRTYTPSEIEASSEGSHVPLEMARLKRSSPSEYKKIHDGLLSFGEKSGLFDDIDLRLFGNRDVDPFQVVVKTHGPPFNLVDVGYGVSQALPIIYQLQLSQQRDAFLLQQPEVHLHPKAQAEIGTVVAKLCKQRSDSLYILETHSDYIIDRTRIEIANGNLDHKNATIIFFEREGREVRATNIYFSEKGEILKPPPTFRKFFLEEHARLLGI